MILIHLRFVVVHMMMNETVKMSKMIQMMKVLVETK
jgi:hypothetical protein